MKCLLITHVSPVIHGQSMMAELLVSSSQQWDDIELSTINTVYTSDRNNLGSFRFGKLKRLFHYIFSAVKAARQESIDIVILTPGFQLGALCKDMLMTLALWSMSDVKIVGWVHMDPSRLRLRQKNKLIRTWIEASLGMIDHWVGCAPKLAKTWPPLVPEPRSAVANGIEDPTNDLELSEVRVSRQKKRIIYLSAMEEAKGWKELFEVAQKLCATNADLIFEFYGGVGVGSSEEELNTMFDKSSFPKQMLWHGPAYGEEKHKAFLNADLFILPSHTEQFPIAVIEAMAYALPVVATDVGAVSDALYQQQLVEVQSVDSLQSVISSKLSDWQQAQEEGWQNRRRFQEHFSAPSFSKNWRKLLQDMYQN